MEQQRHLQPTQRAVCTTRAQSRADKCFQGMQGEFLCKPFSQGGCAQPVFDHTLTPGSRNIHFPFFKHLLSSKVVTRVTTL